MTTTEQRIVPSPGAGQMSIDWDEVRRHWPIYSAYALFAIALLLASFGRAIAGLKPGEVALIMLAGALALRRVVRHDFSFAVTSVDAAFLIFIAAGTILPLITLEARGIYLTKDNFRGVIGPVEYYLWYRVILEAIPLPSRLPQLTKVMLVVLTIISAIGILQVIHFPEVQKVLVKFFPSYETTESPAVHRATSLVGGWETLAALAAYILILINQLQTRGESVKALGKNWDRWLVVMLAINVVALISTLSFAGVTALAVGYVIAWRLNGQLARATRVAFIVGIVAAVLLSPFIAERLIAQYSHHLHSGNLLSALVPQTWSQRAQHWVIVSSAVFVSLPFALFGVQPAFAYPVLSFGSTESLFFLLLYRGGLIYLAAFGVCVYLVWRALARALKRSSGFPRQFLLGAITVLAMNLIIDIFDAHLFGAGEAQFIFTMLAVSIGVAQRTDRVIDDTPGEHTAERRAVSVALPDRAGRLVAVLAGATLIVVLASLGAGLALNRSVTPPPAVMTVTTVNASSAIFNENQKLGTSAWQLDSGLISTTNLVGFAGATSALPGDTVSLYISASHPTSYDLNVYRLGWYYGLGGRLYLSATNLAAPTQGTWSLTGGLAGCSACVMDTTTHLLDTHWSMTYQLHIGTSWPTGVYLIKLASRSLSPRAESYIPLVVRNAKNASTVLVVLPFNTYEAENAWGGFSMLGPAGTTTPGAANPNRARQVSFNRPFSQSAGTGDLLNYDIHTVRWLERSGYDVDYVTDLDLAANPALVLTHKAVIIAGHSAYWTQSMRNALDIARGVRIGLAFLGGGDGYWQARLAPDAAGGANRTLICYKVSTNGATPADQLSADPLYATQPALVTARWRDPAINRPENEVMGLMYGFTIDSTGFYAPDWVVPLGKLTHIEAQLSMVPGETVSNGLLGGPLDTIVPNGQTPHNLVILAQSPVLDLSDQLQTAYTSYYLATSGSLVFDAGTSQWAFGLDEFTPPGADMSNILQGNASISGMTQVMLDSMVGPAPAASQLAIPPPGQAQNP